MFGNHFEVQVVPNVIFSVFFFFGRIRDKYLKLGKRLRIARACFKPNRF